MFSNPEVPGVLGVQEVADLLIVDFDIGYFYREINVWIDGLLLLDAREQLGTCEWDDTLVGAIFDVLSTHSEHGKHCGRALFCTGRRHGGIEGIALPHT